MKKLLLLLSVLFAFLLTACPSPQTGTAANPDTESEESQGDDTGGETGGENVTLEEADYTFIRGFDASQVDWYEEGYSLKWKDTDGNQKDFFEILKANGVNTVRLRIWNDPAQFSKSINYGDNTLERTIKTAKRVKDAALDLMLDFHYSDTWTDPGRQIVPAAWKNLSSEDEVASALSAYTTQVLEAIKSQAKIIPRYVQVGNEINPGLLCHTSNSSEDNNDISEFAFAGKSYEEGNSSFVPSAMVKYLKAGADAVRAFNPDIKIVLHLAGDPWYDDSWFFDPVKNGKVPFDIIGYSFYPWESSGTTISDLKKKIAFQKERYGVDVIVAESSSHWKDEGDLTYQKRTYASMTDPATGLLYEDLESALSDDEYYLKGSVENQKKVLLHVMNEVYASGGAGVFAWGGDLYGNYRWGMFDSNGKALQSLTAFSQELSEPVEYFTGTLFDAEVLGEGTSVFLIEAENFSSVSDTASVTVSFVWVSETEDKGEGGPSCGAGENWPALEWEGNTGSASFTGEDLALLKEHGLSLWLPSGVTYKVTVTVED